MCVLHPAEMTCHALSETKREKQMKHLACEGGNKRQHTVWCLSVYFERQSLAADFSTKNSMNIGLKRH